MAASRAEVIVRSLEPLSPLVTTTRPTSLPSLTNFATVPPAPNSQSSGWAVITRTRRMGSLMRSVISRRTSIVEMPSSSIPIRPRRRAIIALPMAADRGRRIALIVLVVLLLLPLPATVLPGSPTAIRIAAAPLLGARRWQASVLAAALALLVTLTPGTGRRRGGMLAAGGAALLLVLVVVGVAGEVAPWTAWSQAAARPALVFSGRSGWVTEGERFVRGTTLAFDEAHRVVALTPGTFRVVEQDGGRRVVRDWRLAVGDAISLRPGDTLTASAGSRLRFEPGKRVPGTAPSGAAWADAAARVPAARALGLLATFALGACAVVPAGGRRVGVAGSAGRSRRSARCSAPLSMPASSSSPLCCRPRWPRSVPRRCSPPRPPPGPS